jgi:RNA polymerase sigma-70 factor, ECF subfamily
MLGSPSTDARAIEASLTEPEAFAIVFDRHFPAISRYLRARVGAALAEDLASQTFLLAFDRRAGYEVSRPDARPWLYGIASNLVRRHRRTEERRLRAQARAAAQPEGEPAVEGLLAAPSARERAALADGIAALKAPDREVLLLHAVAGLGYEEIAAALGIAAGTVGSRLARARRLLRDRLEAVAPEDPAPATLARR